jgi:archaellum component FlaC
MSEPQRFRVADIQAQMTLGGQIMEVHPDGHYVTYSEYARLAFKSECQAEGLNAFDNKLREAEGLIARMNDTINASQAECRRLKAEVERLTNSHSIDFVRAEMYRHLLDENAKLKEEVMRMRNDAYKEGDILQKCCEHQKNRIERLKAEVERLTKAEDKMIEVTYIKGVAGVDGKGGKK